MIVSKYKGALCGMFLLLALLSCNTPETEPDALPSPIAPTATSATDTTAVPPITRGDGQNWEPLARFTAVFSASIHAQNPAYLQYELSGVEIEEAALRGWQEENGRLRLYTETQLQPENGRWQGGVYQETAFWNGQGTYLYDAQGNGAFVPLLGGKTAVEGVWLADDEIEEESVTLRFDRSNGRLTSPVAAGAVFQPYLFYQGAEGKLVADAGPPLTVDDAGLLYLGQRPLPDGRYLLTLVANQEEVASTAVAVDNSAVVPQRALYIDPLRGIRFLYPEGWQQSGENGAVILHDDKGGQAQFVILSNPPADATALKMETLAQFGAVDILFEEPKRIGGAHGLQTAYGYTDQNGADHTGILLAFIHNGRGYALDVDGLTANQEGTLTAVDAIVQSWNFLPAPSLQHSAWEPVVLERFALAKPIRFTHQTVNHWERFAEGANIFIALRRQPSSGSAAEAMDLLLKDAAVGLEDFSSEEPTTQQINGMEWNRIDFSYTTEAGLTIWGFLMATVSEDVETAVWVEAPDYEYNDLETAVFLPMIADLTPLNPD